MTCSVAARNIVSNCYFPVGRPFSCSSAGRPSLRWVGLKTASLQPAPVRAAPVRAACCRGLRVRRAWRSLFFVFVPSHACRPSGQPFFSNGFRIFPMPTRKCVCGPLCFPVPFVRITVLVFPVPLGINVHPFDLNLDFLPFLLHRSFGRRRSITL